MTAFDPCHKKRFFWLLFVSIDGIHPHELLKLI